MIRLLVGLLLLGAPAPALASTGLLAAAVDPRGGEAVKQARYGLAVYDRLAYELEKSSAGNVPDVLEQMETETQDALSAVLKAVSSAHRADGPVVVGAYQIAKDALNSNKSPDIRTRIAYNVGALRQIAKLR